jgi:hypothetical protein
MALVARGIRQGKTLLWEYRFPFGGPPVWTSGFAQAVGAQALARSGDLLGDQSLLDAAERAFTALPGGLSLPLGGGMWVREYGFADIAILNAQLQSILSLDEYARLAGDAAASSFATEMTTAARNLIHEFDTGCWSRYSLGGAPASLHYHDFHVRLLQMLADRTGDPVWRDAAARWTGYQDQGPC